MMKSKASAAKLGNQSSQDDSSSGSDLSTSDDGLFAKTTSSSSSSSSSSLRSYDNMVMTMKSPTLKYTSLRDILPVSPPPPPPPPPPLQPAPAPLTPPATTAIHGSSWNEIPITIKDPLVKQAALAYLQPMVSPTELVEEGLFGKFKEACCCGQRGCLAWFNGVVSGVARDMFGKRQDDDDDDDDDCDDEDMRFE